MPGTAIPTKKRISLTQMAPTKIPGNINYQNGNAVQMANMDRTMAYRSINLRLQGTLTTSVTTTTANLGAGDEWGVVKGIKLVGNGGQFFRSISGEQLCVLNCLAAGFFKKLNTLSGVAGNYAFDSTIPLWLCLPNDLGKNELDTTLNAPLLSDLYLEIDWGGPTDINDGGTGSSSFLVSPTVEVVTDQSFFLNKTVVAPYAITQIQQTILNNQAPSGKGTSGNVWQVPVGQNYPFILFNNKLTGTLTDATGLAGAFGQLLFQSGTNQLHLTDLVLERQMNRYRRQVSVDSFTPMFNNTKNNPAAWVLWLAAKEKYLTEGLNLVNYQNCNAYIENSANFNVDTRIIPMSLFPITQAVGGG